MPGSRDDASLRTIICIPTYDEALNVRAIVSAVLAAQPEVHVLVVDDNSPDGTGEIADEMASADDRVFVLHRKQKNGLGAAYLDAFAWGLARGYEVLVEMDADGSHRPVDLGGLLDAIRGGADLALGSRWIAGGSVVNWARHRQWLSRGGNIYARLMLGIPINDATGGFRAFRASALTAVHLGDVASQGYCFQVDLARRAIAHGLVVVEVPITFVERELGTSKMSSGIVAEALWRVTVWGVSRRCGRLGRAVGRVRRTTA